MTKEQQCSISGAAYVNGEQTCWCNAGSLQPLSSKHNLEWALERVKTFDPSKGLMPYQAGMIALSAEVERLRNALSQSVETVRSLMRPDETTLPIPERAWVEPRGVGFAVIACFLKAEDAQLVRNHLAMPAVEPTATQVNNPLAIT